MRYPVPENIEIIWILKSWLLSEIVTKCILGTSRLQATFFTLLNNKTTGKHSIVENSESYLFISPSFLHPDFGNENIYLQWQIGKDTAR